MCGLYLKMLWYSFHVWKVESAHGSERSNKTQEDGHGLAWVNGLSENNK